MVVAKSGGKDYGESFFNGYRVSFWEEERVLEINGGGGCAIMWVYLKCH